MTVPCRCVIVSGVAGSGRSTLAHLLAAGLGWTYAEGDAFHPERDNASWLAAIATWIDHRSPETGTVLTCSALRRAYREELAEGRPWLRFCQLEAPYRGVPLIDGQLVALEPLGFDEPGIVMNASEPPARLRDDVVEILSLTADATPEGVGT